MPPNVELGRIGASRTASWVSLYFIPPIFLVLRDLMYRAGFRSVPGLRFTGQDTLNVYSETIKNKTVQIEIGLSENGRNP
jgi:hypothetical protein